MWPDSAAGRTRVPSGPKTGRRIGGCLFSPLAAEGFLVRGRNRTAFRHCAPRVSGRETSARKRTRLQPTVGGTSAGATTTIAKDKVSLVVGLRCSILGFASTTVVLDGSFSLAGFGMFDRRVAGTYRRLQGALAKVGSDRATQKRCTVPWQCIASDP